MSTETSRAAAGGKLRDRPVPRLVQQIFRKRVTGCLFVEDDSGDVTRVYTRDGFPVHAERPNDLDRLDNILMASGIVPPQTIAVANLEVQRTGARLGEILVAKGFMTRPSLAEILKTQIRRKLTRLFFAREGSYEIFTEAHAFGAGDEFELMRIDPRGILYSGIRASYDDQRLKQELVPLHGYTFRLVQVPASVLQAMGFPPQDMTLSSLRDRTMTLEEVTLRTVKPQEARAIVLALLYGDLLDASVVGAARQVAPAAPAVSRDLVGGAVQGVVRDIGSGVVSEPVVPPPGAVRTTWQSTRSTTEVIAVPGRGQVASRGGAAPSAGGAAPASAGGAGSSEALRASLADLSARLESISHFELLGVPESASDGEVSAAYMKALRQFHPDRLAALGLRDMAAQAERVTARMGEASSMLGDSKRRAEYLATRSGKKPEIAATSVLEAENRFAKGEVFLKKADYAHAVESFTEAIKLNPAEPEYKAYLAWARFEDPRARKDLIARECLAAMEEGIRERPKFGRAHYWAGQIWKFLNDPARAEKAFREALKVDPNLVEAEREARLLEMRRAKAAEARPAAKGPQTARQAGLFGKLFNKKD